MRFADRRHAGHELAQRLLPLHLASPVILGLPRGGVPVAAEVAAALDAPLDVFVACKIGAPDHREFGIGAVAEGVEDPLMTKSSWLLGLGRSELDGLAAQARQELERRVTRYRGDRPLPDLSGKEVVVIDDGMATGVTAEAALRALRRHHTKQLILAVPVCAQETATRLATVADQVICPTALDDLCAVGLWYDDFSATSDDEVLDLLARNRARPVPLAPSSPTPPI